MKTVKFFQSKAKATAAFMLAAIATVGVISLSSNTNSDEELLAEQEVSAGFFDQMEDATKAYNLLREMDGKKANLEQKKAELKEKIVKAEQDRNKNRGMVAGVTFQMPQDLPEISTLQSKMKRINMKIDALNKSEEAIASKYGINLKKVATGQEYLTCK